MKNTFHNADEAYEALLDEVIINGIEFDGTQAIFNCGFYITNPEDNHIKNKQQQITLASGWKPCSSSETLPFSHHSSVRCRFAAL